MPLFRLIFIPLVLEFFDFIHAPFASDASIDFKIILLSSTVSVGRLSRSWCAHLLVWHIEGAIHRYACDFIRSYHCFLHWLIETRKFWMRFLKMDTKRNVSLLSFVHLATFGNVQCASAAFLSLWQITSHRIDAFEWISVDFNAQSRLSISS